MPSLLMQSVFLGAHAILIALIGLVLVGTAESDYKALKDASKMNTLLLEELKRAGTGLTKLFVGSVIVAVLQTVVMLVSVAFTDNTQHPIVDGVITIVSIILYVILAALLFSWKGSAEDWKKHIENKRGGSPTAQDVKALAEQRAAERKTLLDKK